MAIGTGFDIHKLVPGRKLVLGGVAIDHPKGLLGHSDADAVLHALIDALLGASGGGDIGQKFPDTDDTWRDASSVDLLKRVAAELSSAWNIINVDLTVIAEEPKMGPHREAIRKNIAGTLGLDVGRVNLKAKTMEGLGPIGSGDAIAAQAGVELQPK